MAKNKEPNKTELLARYTQECEERFARWDELYKNGGSDPTYADGVNLNLVRNHITYRKEKIIALCDELGCEVPSVAVRETPPEVDDNYMANEEDIIRNAQKAFKVLSTHPSYKKLLSLKKDYAEKELEKIHYRSVMGYVSRLERALAARNLVMLRLYRNYARYIESFNDCLQRSKELTPENVQLSLFDILAV